MLLSEAFQAYRRDVIVFRGQSHTSEELLICALRSLERYMGDIDMQQLDFESIRKWKLNLEHKGVSAGTINNYISKLRMVLNYLRLKGYDYLDPALVPLSKRVFAVPKVLSAEDINRLIVACKYTRNCLRNQLIISMLYSTGLRINELVNLNRSDLVNDYFTVMGKGGKPRICFIDPRTRKLIDRYFNQRKDQENCFLLGKYGRLTTGAIEMMFKLLRRPAGFDWDVHPHSLRHSFATNMHLNGAPLFAVKEMMGHASLNTTAQYLHIYDAQLAETHEKYHTV